MSTEHPGGYGSVGAAITGGMSLLYAAESPDRSRWPVIPGRRVAGGQVQPGAPFVPAVGAVIEPGYARPACESVDPELFHSIDRDTLQKAKEWCRSCPYRRPCLEAALERDESGVWGGTTEAERRDLKRHRKKAQR